MKLIICLWFTVYIMLTNTPPSAAVPQKIVLYKEADCSSDHFDVIDETTVIVGTGFEGAKSVLVTGVWEVILKDGANQDVCHLLHQQPDNSNCTNTQDFAGTGHTFRQVNRIGLAEIDTSALILATEQQLGGERTMVRGRWSADWPLNIKSIALFAPSRKWNVYGYADYEGFAACIAADDSTKKHFVADLERTLQAQSAKPDTSGYCPWDEIILPPPGEITSPVPTTDPTASTTTTTTTTETPPPSPPTSPVTYPSTTVTTPQTTTTQATSTTTAALPTTTTPGTPVSTTTGSSPGDPCNEDCEYKAVDCHRYYTCINYQYKVYHECPAQMGLAFNPLFRVCDRMENVKGCEPSNCVCGYKPNIQNCDLYYFCQNICQQATCELRGCPGGLRWTVDLYGDGSGHQQCVPASQAVCA